MNVSGAAVVVTGAGSGIGAALARRFAADGAEAVVVADRAAGAAQAVAGEFGGTAEALDVTDEAAVTGLVERTVARFGRVDLFCSNAGIGTGAGLDGPIEAWRQAFEVHVLAHLFAARAVVPHMLARGRGYLLNTASAAGLLTLPSDGPYTVSKHGAVALAEWLAVSYGDRGIGISVLCPLGVATPLLLDGLAADEPSARAVAASGQIVTPEQVADAVVAGLARESFLILPHPEVATYWSHKAADPDQWLAGVRRLVARTDSPGDAP